MKIQFLGITLFLFLVSLGSYADDGYNLWLKYDRIKDAKVVNAYKTQLSNIQFDSKDETQTIAAKEFKMAFEGLVGSSIGLNLNSSKSLKLKIDSSVDSEDGFKISSKTSGITISAKKSIGLLYGTFDLIRKLQMGQNIQNLNIESSPQINLRLLNHWDNNNGTIERGYAGQSLWKWSDLPEVIDQRYIDYARANASIGINGTVLNNVNASARFIIEEYLYKVKALADVFRPYGIKVYLSVNFASPKLIGGLATADPLEPEVRDFWKNKVSEIYKIIPDFGGLLVKANSEGEPGPMDYGRTHVDGANMLAEALKPYKGLLMWRAFVYKSDPNGDRFKAAYEEFKPFDGQFMENVIIQVKNGPIDFQPREPYSPLFGAMKKTPVSIEFQLSQEYLGMATHLAYLAPLMKEVLDFDTQVNGKRNTIADIVKGSVFPSKLSSMVGVANTGSDRNWTGHPLAQANWYALGRLAWNTNISSEQISNEFAAQAISKDKTVQQTVSNILGESREIFVNYTSPLGLHHNMGEGHHYGPEPWVSKAPRPDWTAVYYHKADENGIGFDRTLNGSNALSQYPDAVQKLYGNINSCPVNMLLWFHHPNWTHTLSTSKTLWDEMVNRFYTGAESVNLMQKKWDTLKDKIDPYLYSQVQGKFKKQYKEALWYRDANVLYFQQFSKLPIPKEFANPNRSLEEVKKIVDTYHIK
jgi:alpha-glucuronidase